MSILETDARRIFATNNVNCRVSNLQLSEADSASGKCDICAFKDVKIRSPVGRSLNIFIVAIVNYYKFSSLSVAMTTG